MVITLEWDLVEMASYSVSQGDESTTAYADWSAYKGQTGDQGYGITTSDVVFLVTRYQ